MKNSIKTLAMWLIIGIIFIVLLTSILDNSDTKMTYAELINKKIGRASCRERVFDIVLVWVVGV